MRYVCVVLMIAALAIGVAGSASANLLVNGSFESGDWNLPSSWSVAASNNSGNLQRPGNAVPPDGWNGTMAVDGSAVFGMRRKASTYGVLKQTVTGLTPGMEYILSGYGIVTHYQPYYWNSENYPNNPNPYVSESNPYGDPQVGIGVDPFVSGIYEDAEWAKIGYLRDASGVEVVRPNFEWRTLSVRFTAAGTSADIYLMLDQRGAWDNNDDNSSWGGPYTVLDDVRLVAVPEPSSLVALCTGGLGVLGMAIRRRKA